MMTELKIADVTIDVVKKDIKNIHLSVNPPSGHVRIAVPHNVSSHVIRSFVLSKLSWIRKKQKKMRTQERERPKQYIERESHFLWGRRYLLHVIEKCEVTDLSVGVKKMTLKMKKSARWSKAKELFDQLYKNELRNIATPKIKKWAKTLGVDAPDLEIRKMKTRWGSCSIKSGRIRLNSELAKRPKELLNYVILHEMAHLIEKNHNQRYFDILDRYMPNWEHYRNELNSWPVPSGHWK